MAEDPSWVPPGVDTTRANVARVYDYLLGGSHNFLSDQDAARAVVSVEPDARVMARANRAFLGRAVRYLAGQGITQFLDIGSGIPTQGNVHEVAQRASPGSRVVYVDTDPVAIAHSKAILSGKANTTIVDADLRDPEKVLGSAGARKLLDLTKPAGLLLVSVLHFIPDGQDPYRIVATLRDALAPGSYLAICHGTDEGKAAASTVAQVYNRKVTTSVYLRSRPDILRFFDGFDLVDPGLVRIPEWRPDSPGDVPDNPGQFLALVGVGRKP
jgi:hypothetical protein